ncbi:hypothetical protein AB1Y20_001433 [Prymnesium parvum]|uniref:Uncharacterized protein n=1 Tax=Prymnesium parvum TaxID=97485 RepID=A0AB34KB21_PRYPA
MAAPLAFAALLEGNGAAEAAAALSTCSTLTENALRDPLKFGRLNARAKAIHSRLLPLAGGEASLLACGFRREGEAYVHDGSDADAAASATAARAAIAHFDKLRAAVERVGDSNAPAVATEAIKLCAVYCANAASDDARRRIPAAGKAVATRLLAAIGGQALLEASGFELQGDAFVCALDPPMLAWSGVILGKAESFWQLLAREREGDAGGGGSLDGPENEPTPRPIAKDEIKLAALPVGLDGRRGAVDLEPLLVRSADKSRVQLYCWHPVSKRWRLVGSMRFASSEFEWASENTPAGGESRAGSRPEMRIEVEVDLGDHKPVWLGMAIDDSLKFTPSENEYIAAKRFIDEHFESLNNNHLEPIARKLRAVVEPLLETIRNLKAAVEEQS